MLRLLLTTAPLLAQLVLAAPGLDPREHTARQNPGDNSQRNPLGKGVLESIATQDTPNYGQGVLESIVTHGSPNIGKGVLESAVTRNYPKTGNKIGKGVLETTGTRDASNIGKGVSESLIIHEVPSTGNKIGKGVSRSATLDSHNIGKGVLETTGTRDASNIGKGVVQSLGDMDPEVLEDDNIEPPPENIEPPRENIEPPPENIEPPPENNEPPPENNEPPPENIEPPPENIEPPPENIEPLPENLEPPPPPEPLPELWDDGNGPIDPETEAQNTALREQEEALYAGEEGGDEDDEDEDDNSVVRLGRGFSPKLKGYKGIANKKRHIYDEKTVKLRALTKKNVLYFTNWGIYGADFQPQQIPAANVTHLLYSFLDIATDGTVISSDTWSDIEKRYSTDSWSEPGYNVYGCVKQLYVLKKKYRKFKTLLSIGGWTYSSKFAPVAANPTKRKKFVASAVKLLADWGFDGVDVDWEYPSTASDANNYVLLLKELRAGLDDYAAKNNMKYRFIITVASAAGPAQYGVMNLKGMNPYVDAWHLMAYDYSGPWDRVTGHQANLYPSQANLMSSPYNTNKAVADYMAQGISASKIVMGMPLYGRSFAKTTGPGKPYTGVGGGSTVGQTTTPGIWLYKDLPRPGAQVTINSQAVGVWSFDAVSKEYVTYDNIHTARIKANYITNKNLGGAMYWEASGDKTGVDSIVKTVANQFGTLDTTQNMLWYPTSAYANMRAGMPS